MNWSGSADVVVVDPDQAVADDLQQGLGQLAESVRITHVETPSDIDWEWLQGIDCVVSEYAFPDETGLELLQAARDVDPEVQFIIHTAEGGEAVASEAISAGVTDYVAKSDGQGNLLANRVVHAIAEKRAAERAEQIERVNRVLREIDAALVRADTRREIEQGVCDILAESEQYLFAWVGEYVPEEHQLLPRAHAGCGEEFLDQIPVGEGSTLPEEGPGPRSLETGEIQVTQNIAADDTFDEYQEIVEAQGYRSVATIPLAHEDTLYGLVAIYADRPYAFDDAERELLESLGQDVGHAIHAVELKADLRKYREAFEHAGHAMCLTGPGGEIERVNAAFGEQTGYSPESVVGTPLSSIQPVGPEEVRGESGSIARGEDWKRDLVATRQDGSEYHAEQTIAPIKDSEGTLQGFVVIQADVTERREREAEIRREREMLDSVFDTSPTGIVVLSPSGDIVRANQRAEEILELSEAEITDRTYDEPTWVFTDPSGNPIPEAEHPFRQAVEEQAEITDLELRMEREHAEPIWVAINGAPLFAPDGSLERLVFTFDDITDIKTTQRELEETNRTLEALIQTSPVAILAQDLDGEITRWNEGAEEIFGWSEAEVLGLSKPPFVPDSALEEYHELFERVRRGESFTGLEITRERKDGTPVDLHLSAAPIRDAEGEVTGIMAVFADLTDQKVRERQLRQFREAVEHTGHNVMITDREGTIQYVNPAFEEQTGYSADEALGRTPAILKSGAHDAAFYEEMWETILDGEVWQREIENQRKDGSRFHVAQTIAPVFDDDGDIQHFVAVNHDITERKEKELALERQNRRLEEFASVVSHDLRNPLTVARGNLELIENGEEHAERIAESLERMDAIIDDVLTLARDGETVENVEPIDVASLAREAETTVELPEGALTVEGQPSIAGDAKRARRILENLYRNAVEHVGPEVNIHIGSIDGDGFYVEDDGPGIDPEDRDIVFESGYTTESSGTGLGLAIVNRLAEAQGWAVTLSEGTEGGARFEFRPSGAPE